MSSGKSTAPHGGSAPDQHAETPGEWRIILRDIKNVAPGSLIWSDSVYRIFGYLPGEVRVSLDFYLGRVPRDESYTVKSILSEAIKNRSEYSIEHRIIRKDRSEGLIRVIGSCEEYCGDWILMRGTVTDISACKTDQMDGHPFSRIFNGSSVSHGPATQERCESGGAGPVAGPPSSHQSGSVFYPELSRRLTDTITHLNDSQRIAHIGSWQIVLKDKDTGVPGSHQWSDEVFRLMGYEPGEVVASMSLFWEHVHPADVKKVETVMQKSLVSLTPYDVEHRIIRKDGTTVVVHERGECTKYPGDGWVKMVGTCQDVTSLKQAEKYEAGLKSIFENTSVAYTLLDEALNIVLFNQAASEGTQLEQGQELRIGASILDYVVPERKATVRKLYSSVVKGRKHSYELHFRKPDGEVHWYWVTLFPVLLDHQESLGMVMSMHDITDRKIAEDTLRKKAAKYRSFFENCTAGILLAEPGGKIIAANPSACTLFRMSEQEICYAGRDGIVDARHPDFLCLLESRHRTGFARAELTFVRKDGTSFPCETSVTMYQEADGEDRVSVIISDITARKEAQAAHEQRQRDFQNHLEQLNTVREEERTAVAKEIHDELGQQLSTLKLGVRNVKSKLAQHNLEDDTTEMLLNEIDEAIKSVRRIAYNLHPVILDSEGLAAAIKCYVSEFERLHGISCYTDIELPDDIVDKKISLALFRIFQETLTNVMRHAKADYIELLLKQHRGAFIMTVSDNGCGINLDELSRKRTFGIISMKERAAALGGRYTIDRKKPTGTITRVVIPTATDTANSAS